MDCRFQDEFDSERHKMVEKYVFSMKLYRLYLERELNRSGVFRSQHQILMYISRFPNASQKDIASHQHVSTATIAVTLKKLEKGGYISRVMDEDDNRFNQIRITPKGKDVVDVSIQVFRKVEQAIFNSFTDEELHMFDNFLDRTKLNIEYLFQESSGADTQSKSDRHNQTDSIE